MNKLATLFSVAAAAGVSTTATADVLTYYANETSAGTWEIFVEVTGDQSNGLATVGIRLVGLTDGTVGEFYTENVLTTQSETFGFATGGFTTLPTQSDVSQEGFTLTHTQRNSVNPLFDIGIIPHNIIGFDVPPNLDNPDIVLGVPALVGTLTTDEVLTAANFEFTGALFDETRTSGIDSLLEEGTEYTINSVVTPIPEPGSLALLGLGGLLIATRRRRSA